MKIGIEAQRLFRPRKHGMDIYALELIRALQRLDQQNEYIVFVRPDSDVCLEESENLRIWPIKALTYADWEQVALPLAVRKSGVDLVHFTSNTASLSIACPYVLTLHDVIFLENKRSGGSWYQQAGHYYRRWVVPGVAQRASYVLTVSGYEKQQILDKLPELTTAVKPIHNAISARFQPVEDERFLRTIREQYVLPARFLFFLGNQAPKKNMLRVLQAYADYADQDTDPIKLVIAESSADQVLAMLRQLDRTDIWQRIRLTGYIPQTDLPALYSLATAFLYPSLRESFGIPILEAMACGTPVITATTSAMPEVAGGAALLVDPESVKELTEAIQRVVTDKPMLQRLTQAGLRRASTFSWDHTAQQTRAVYQRVMAKSRNILAKQTSL